MGKKNGQKEVLFYFYSGTKRSNSGSAPVGSWTVSMSLTPRHAIFCELVSYHCVFRKIIGNKLYKMKCKIANQ